MQVFMLLTLAYECNACREESQLYQIGMMYMQMWHFSAKKYSWINTVHLLKCMFIPKLEHYDKF